MGKFAVLICLVALCGCGARDIADQWVVPVDVYDDVVPSDENGLDPPYEVVIEVVDTQDDVVNELYDKCTVYEGVWECSYFESGLYYGTIVVGFYSMTGGYEVVFTVENVDIGGVYFLHCDLENEGVWDTGHTTMFMQPDGKIKMIFDEGEEGTHPFVYMCESR